jgi:hypothetical protein
MPRGGRRPGAGAPRGNTNSLKHGLYSRRIYLAALMLAAVPELRLLFKSLAQDRSGKYHAAHRQAFRDAYRVVLADAELASSIKSLIVERFKGTVFQIEEPEAPQNIEKAINQSKLAGHRKPLPTR